MAKDLQRKALISITSYNGVIYPDGTKTGLFFTEALHPLEVLTQAGFEVDLATETGTYGLDDLSLTSQFLAGDDKSVFENPKHPFNVKLNAQLKKAADLKKDEYGLVLRFRRPCRSLRLPHGPRASEHCGRRLGSGRDRHSRMPRTGASPRGNRLQDRQVDHRGQDCYRIYH